MKTFLALVFTEQDQGYKKVNKKADKQKKMILGYIISDLEEKDLL